MYKITHDIRVGEAPTQYRLKNVAEVWVNKSVHHLSDTATLRLVARHKNVSQDIEKHLSVGSPIRIAFGYNQDNKLELQGYIQNLYYEKEHLVLQCEDQAYLFRKQVANKVFPQDTPFESILKHVLDQTDPSPSLELHPSLKRLKHAQFSLVETSAYETLKYLQQLHRIHLYVRQKTLYAVPYAVQDVSMNGKYISYRASKNIEKSSLRYVGQKDKKVLVRIVSANEKGERVEAEAGERGGEIVVRRPQGLSDPNTLHHLAQAELNRHNYEGYEGHLTSWLLPYCTHGLLARFQDPEYPAKEGSYFVEQVTTTLSAKGGGSRKVYLGKKTDP